jgi:hypothetical protein
MPKITKRLVEAIEPENKDVIIRDSELKGFICKVTPRGKRVYLLYYRTKEGRERKPSIGIHGHITCDQARDTALNWLSDVAKGKDPSQEKKSEKTYVTIADLAERYLEEYAAIYKKPASIRNDKLFLKHYIIPNLGKIKINSLTGKDIANFHYNMREKSTTANRCISVISKMLNLAEKWGLRNDASMLCKHIDKYQENKREKFLSLQEIEKLSKVLRESSINYGGTKMPSAIAAIRLLLLTGCRLSEILTLKWGYIDYKHHRINFPDSKTGKKTIYISPFVLEVLDGIEKQKNNPYVIYGAIEGKHLINLRKSWCRIRKLADLEDVRIHDLRHSFASIGAASGLSLPIIGALLGHTQAQTTARYAHLIGEPLKEAASLIGEKMKSIVC